MWLGSFLLNLVQMIPNVHLRDFRKERSYLSNNGTTWISQQSGSRSRSRRILTACRCRIVKNNHDFPYRKFNFSRALGNLARHTCQISRKMTWLIGVRAGFSELRGNVSVNRRAGSSKCAFKSQPFEATLSGLFTSTAGILVKRRQRKGFSKRLSAFSK